MYAFVLCDHKLFTKWRRKLESSIMTARRKDWQGTRYASNAVSQARRPDGVLILTVINFEAQR